MTKSVKGYWLRGWRALLKVLDAAPESSSPVEERWPTTRQGFLWDIAPAEVAPSRDGVVAPREEPEPWLARIGQSATEAQLQTFIELERRKRDESKSAAETAESKASRLITPLVVLLGGAVAVVGWQLNAATHARTAAGMTFLFTCAVPGILAVWFLFVAAVRALDADIRVGIYRKVSPTKLADTDPRSLLKAEHLAAIRAGWNARKKVTRLMYARSAMSRAILFLGIALAISAVMVVGRGYVGLSQNGPKPAPSESPRSAVSPGPSVPTGSQKAPTPTTGSTGPP